MKSGFQVSAFENLKLMQKEHFKIGINEKCWFALWVMTGYEICDFCLLSLNFVEMVNFHKDVIDLKFKTQNLKMWFLFISAIEQDVVINFSFMANQGTLSCGWKALAKRLGRWFMGEELDIQDLILRSMLEQNCQTKPKLWFSLFKVYFLFACLFLRQGYPV